MDAESFNVAIVRGTCSSPPELRVLPSSQRLAQLQVTTRVDGRAMSVPVSVVDPPAWLEALDVGDELVVLGAVRRRFFRAAGSTASRVEIEAEVVCRGRDRRRSRGLRRRVEELSRPWRRDEHVRRARRNRASDTGDPRARRYSGGARGR